MVDFSKNVNIKRFLIRKSFKFYIYTIKETFLKLLLLVFNTFMKNIAFIPARIGSTRLAKKGLAKINNETLLSIAIKKTILSNSFDEVICLGDSNEFRNISEENNIIYLDRDPNTATNQAKADDVVNEIIAKTNSDNIFWINLTHPFTTIDSIRGAVHQLTNSKEIDSIFTAHSWLGHASFDSFFEVPLNFDKNSPFAQTQYMKEIFLFTYGLMAWKTIPFLERFRLKSSAMTNGTIGTIKVSRLESIWIKNPSDLNMVLEIVKNKNIWDFIK